MFKRVIILALSLLTLQLSLFSAVGTKRLIEPEDVVMIKSVSDPQISPDGKYVAFVVTEVDTNNTEKHHNSDIWIVPSSLSEKPRKYVFGPNNETMPRWSPDGKYLAFLSDRGKNGKNQLYLIRTDGGEAFPLTSLSGGVTKFKWFNDSQIIFFTAKDSISSKKKKRLDKKDDEIVVDEEFLFNRLYEININTREIKLITTFDENINDFDFSPDGSGIVLSVSPTPRLDDVYRKSKLVLIKRDGSDKKVLSEKCYGNLHWSPDGKKILFETPFSKGIASRLCIYHLPSGKKEVLLKEYKGAVTQMEWLNDSKSVLAFSQEGTRGYIVRINTVTGDVKRLKFLKHPNYSVVFWSFDKNFKHIAYLDAGYDSPTDVWLMKSNGQKAKRLSNMNPQVDSLKFGKVKTIRWKSKDGTEIEGILIMPADYKDGQKYPIVVQIHGGPKWAWWEGWLCSWHNWAQFLASHGYVVLLPNPRGSYGYGWQFEEANYVDWGGGDFEDIMSGVDFLINEGIADPNSIGIGGWSYGGYMTSWVVTQTNRFKAAIMGAGLSNLISMYGTTDIPTFMKSYFNGFPYGREDIYMNHSALHFVKNVTTPTLILHGESDVRVPISQAYEFYRALKDLGVEVKFVIYPREPHGIREPLHQIDLLRRVLNWYDTHLK